MLFFFGGGGGGELLILEHPESHALIMEMAYNSSSVGSLFE